MTSSLSNARCVYFIQAVAGGPIKIGIGQDPEQRLFGLQCGNPNQLQLIAVIPNAKPEDEQALHLRFRSDRLRGEWFEPTSELAAFIATQAQPWVRPVGAGSDIPRATNTLSIDTALLRRLRKRAQVTQVDVARRAGISRQYMNFIESGDRRPNREAISRICDALVCTDEERRRLLAPEDAECGVGPPAA